MNILNRTDYNVRDPRNLEIDNPYMKGVNLYRVDPSQMRSPFMMNTPGVLSNMYTNIYTMPTYEMQAKYNMVIAYGFQSVQEYDKNRFRLFKHMYRKRKECKDMSDREFDEYFDENFIKNAFPERYNLKHNINVEGDVAQTKPKREQRLHVKFKKGDKVLIDVDLNDDSQCMKAMGTLSSKPLIKQGEIEQAEMMYNRSEEFRKQAFAQMHANAIERKYDHCGDINTVLGDCFSELGSKDLWDKYYQQQRDSKNIRNKNGFNNQTKFLRNCLVSGMGIDEAARRYAKENEDFYVNTPLNTGGKRGSFGKMPDGSDLNPNYYPLYGHLMVQVDPKDVNSVMPFPRKYVKDLYKGYEAFCEDTNNRSKTGKVDIMGYDDFETELGINVLSDYDYVNEYGTFEEAKKYVNMAHEAIMAGKKPPHLIAFDAKREKNDRQIKQLLRLWGESPDPMARYRKADLERKIEADYEQKRAYGYSDDEIWGTYGIDIEDIPYFPASRKDEEYPRED